MASVRNPLASFAITIFSALGISFFIGVPILFLPQAELVYFYLPFALFGVGVFAGRGGFLGALGFIGATMGSFIGVYAFQSFFVPLGWPLWPADWAILMDAAFGAACGLGGLASGKLGLRKIEQMTEHAMKMRRCLKCGAKVGIAARKCWSCRAYLPRTG
jgi:ribosomal protein L40E